MVLQQNSTIEVWGTAEVDQKLKVTFADQELDVTADANGSWKTQIKTPAAGGPYELSVAAAEGEPKVTISDVMSGEVWLCVGGGNMAWPVSQVLNAENEIELSKEHQQVRLFSVAEHRAASPMLDFAKVGQAWSVCAPEAVKEYSGTAYFFGRELSKQLKGTPIGLVNASVPFSVCESWCDRKALAEQDSLKPLLQYWEENEEPTQKGRPGTLFNGMISPLKRFPVRGVIWYQGEANNGRAHQYKTMFPVLIQDWRKQFNDERLPFFFCQLAPYRYPELAEDALAEMWDAQVSTLESVENVAMALTADIGNVEERFPKNKQEVGRRLSLLALGSVYKEALEPDQKIICHGPVYKSFKNVGDQIHVEFENVAEGLRILEDADEIAGFSVCDSSQQFVPVAAKLENGKVLLDVKGLKETVAIRYCWGDTIQPNLINSGGLPASPFRTDDFPLKSEGRDY